MEIIQLYSDPYTAYRLSENAISERELYPFIKLQKCLDSLYQNKSDIHYKKQCIRILTYMCVMHRKESMKYILQAYDIDPYDTDVLNNLAFLYHQQLSLYNKSKSLYIAAIDADCTNGTAYSGLGNLLHGVLGQVKSAINYHIMAIQNIPDYAPAYGDILLCLHYFIDSADIIQNVVEALNLSKKITTLSELSQEFMKNLYGAHFHERVYSCIEDRVLKVAFFSSDLNRNHPVWDFTKVLLQSKMDSVELYTFTNSDSLSESESTVQNRNISNMSDDNVLHQLTLDRIHVLVDLSGHTNGSRHRVFAKSTLPVYSYVGYPSNVGIHNMKRITDSVVDPQSDKSVLVLPRPFLCWSPRESCRLYFPLKNESRVYGCSSKLCKINKRVINLWIALLQKDYSSLLRLKSEAFKESYYVQKWKKKFKSVSNRIIFDVHTKDYQKHLEWFNRIDVHLDTFPYSGTTVTMESLYMNVPVVTLRSGIRPESRVTTSILQAIHLSNLVAESEEQYITIAESVDKNQISARKSLINSCLFEDQTFPDTFFDCIKDDIQWHDR